MERSRAKKWALGSFIGGGVVFILGFIVFHAPLTTWLSVFWPDLEPLIKAWKELLMLAMAVALSVLIYKDGSLRRSLLRSNIIQLMIVFALLHLFLATLFKSDATSLLAALAIDLRFFAFFVLAFAATHYLGRKFRTRVLRVTAVAAVSSLVFALALLFLPADSLIVIGYGDTISPYTTIDNNPDFIRINGSLRGPNSLGAYVLIVATLILAYRLYKGVSRPKLWLISVAGALSLVVLWFSYSRSAWLGTAISLLIVAAMFARSKFGSWAGLARTVALPLLGLAVVTAGVVYAYRDTSFISNVIVHEDPDEGNDINSNQGHADSLKDGVKRLLDQPLGAGPGSTGSASIRGDKEDLIIENYYLFVAHESGWLGLGLYLVITLEVMVALFKQRRDWFALSLFASGIGLAIVNLLLPIFTDDTVALVWWGLAGVAVALAGLSGKTKGKGSERKAA